NVVLPPLLTVAAVAYHLGISRVVAIVFAVFMLNAVLFVCIPGLYASWRTPVWRPEPDADAG
ncbi:MAG: hypothetical protein JO269_04000, partial [Burkholderiaceae bacterium]|nr:hypothetical protein [Burkholderiaceae bacterium]